MHPRIPRNFPTLEMMLSDLGNPQARELAKWLGVTERTVYQWKRDGQAPRAVLLALFWLTRWGVSAVDTDRENELSLLQSLTESLRHSNAALLARVARLEATGHFGTANDPTMSPDSTPLRPADIARVRDQATARQELPTPAGSNSPRHGPTRRRAL